MSYSKKPSASNYDEPIRAVVYARYSSHNQTEQSIEGQLHDAYDYAKQHNMTIVNEYIDRALSGTKDDRPAFQQMMRDVEKHQFTVVLVWKLDRFARNRTDAAMYRMHLKKHGARVVSVKENITDDPQGVLLESLIEGMAEYFSRNLSQNIKRGIAENIRKGWFPGGHIPFGYVHQDHKLIPDPATAPIAKEILERFASGDKPAQIVKDLNTRGVRFAKGRPFQLSSIAKIIENPVYMGNLIYAGQLVEGCATPIITPETFELAAARHAANRRAPAASRLPDAHFYLLGKFFCGECGSGMTGDAGTSRTGEMHRYYICRNHKKHHSCKSRRYRKGEMEYAVCKIISDFLLNKRRHTLELMADCIAVEYEKEDFELVEIHDLEAQLKQIDRDLEALVDSLMTMPESARPRIAKRMEDLETQRRDIDVRLAKKRIEHNQRFSRDDFLRGLQGIMTDLESEASRSFIIDRFLNAAYIYNDGRLVVYLNHISGFPDAYRMDDNPPPGGDDYKEGKRIFDGKLPPEIQTLPDFETGSSLVTYAPPNAGKDEPHAPHLFFLHGRLGIVAWMFDTRN